MFFNQQVSYECVLKLGQLQIRLELSICHKQAIYLVYCLFHSAMFDRVLGNIMAPNICPHNFKIYGTSRSTSINTNLVFNLIFFRPET